MAIIEVVILAIQPTALAILLVYAYGVFGRSGQHERTLDAIMGGILGLAAMVSMLAPITLVNGVLAEGVIVDIRSLFVGIAAAYFGLTGGSIALVFAALTRIGIGGDGVVSGVAGMAFAALMGLAWARWVRPRMNNRIGAAIVLGLMISVSLSLAVLLPTPILTKFMTGLAPILAIVNVLGALALSTLIERERSLIARNDPLFSEATTDGLTKILNQKSAIDAFHALHTPHRTDHGTAMFCIDVDEFKQINDTHGHLCGDQVLIDIAARISTCLRPCDIFARLSGDEFIVVLHDLIPEQAKAVAERCRRAVSDIPIISDGTEIDVSVSMGGFWTTCGVAFVDLRSASDQALYRAKAEGRNRIVFDISDLSPSAA